MTEIRVTPSQLRQVADAIDSAAQQVGSSVTEVTHTVNAAVAGGHFKGSSANNLMNRFRVLHGTMEDWQPFLMQFALMLRAAANHFEEADRLDSRFSGGGGGGGGRSGGWTDPNTAYQFDGGQWLRDLNKWAELDETARKHLVKRINSFLLTVNPELKAQWMHFLHGNGFHAMGEAFGGAIDIVTSGFDPSEIAKAGLVTTEAYLMGKGGAFDFVKYTTEGLVDFAATGDASKLFSSTLKGTTYALVPGSKEVMMANAAVQFVGHGICVAVDYGADFLGGGNPVLADGFRQQSASLGQALDRMDLENAFDVTGENLNAFLSGEQDLGTALSNTAAGYGDIVGGGVDTAFEGSKLFWSLSGTASREVGNFGMDLFGVDEATQAQFNANADAFITTAQNLTLSDVGSTANQILDASGDMLVDASKQVDSLLDQGGDLIEDVFSWF